MTRYFSDYDNKKIQIRVRVKRLDSKRLRVKFQVLRRQSVTHDDRTTAVGPALDDWSNPHAELATRRAGPRKKRGAE